MITGKISAELIHSDPADPVDILHKEQSHNPDWMENWEKWNQIFQSVALNDEDAIISAGSSWFPWRCASLLKYTFNIISLSKYSLQSGSFL